MKEDVEFFSRGNYEVCLLHGLSKKNDGGCLIFKKNGLGLIILKRKELECKATVINESFDDFF